MKEQSTNWTAMWAAFLTPVVFGIATSVPEFLRWRGNPSDQMLETVATALPFGFILVALAVASRSRFLRSGWWLFLLTLFSCCMSAASFFLLRHSATGLLIVSPIALVFGLCGALAIGPLTFSLGASLLWTATASRRFPAGCCRTCGYDLTGLKPGAVCPECGESP